jgi:hypothetical protein
LRALAESVLRRLSFALRVTRGRSVDTAPAKGWPIAAGPIEGA